MLADRLMVLRRNGFTLVEMLITVSILIVLVAIAMPNFRTFILNAQIRSTGESLQAGIQLARTEAIRRNTRVSLWLVSGINNNCTLTTTGGAWVVSLDSPVEACNATASDTVSPRLVQAKPANETGSNIGVTATGGNCLSFNGFGGMEVECVNGTDPLTQIDIAGPGGVEARALRIVMSAGGGAHLCDPNADPDNYAAC